MNLGGIPLGSFLAFVFLISFFSIKSLLESNDFWFSKQTMSDTIAIRILRVGI